MIIHVNGNVGVGKYTTARALADHFKAAGHRPRLVDNHAIMNLAFACVDADRNEAYFDEIYYKARALAYEALAQLPHDSLIIMTNILFSDEYFWTSTWDALHELSKQRGDSFVPVLLTCGLDENRRRLQSPERSLHRKLTRTEIFDKSYAHRTDFLHDPANPLALTLDVTASDPQATAAKIAVHVAPYL